MNIVLDMDQTLIDGYFDQPITQRPHLKHFLKWCFDHFQHVSIWTAASYEWYTYVYERVFKDILNEFGVEFHFVFTYNKCTNVWRFLEYEGQTFRWTEKRLRKLHRSKSEKFINYNMDNTIVIDDTQSTFRSNYGNGIHINEFYGFIQSSDRDDEFLKLIIYLRDVVIPYFHEHKTVRSLEKRYWRNYVTIDLLQEELSKTLEYPNQQSNISEP